MQKNQTISRICSLFSKKVLSQEKQEILEKNKEIYELFIKKNTQDEIQKIERWLLK